MRAADLPAWRAAHPELHQRSLDRVKSAPPFNKQQRTHIAALVRDVRRKLSQRAASCERS